MTQSDRDTSTQSQFNLVSVVIQSERLNNPLGLEVNLIVSDFEIYEHLDKPYLTGKLMLVDTENILQDVDFLGGETITIEIKSPKKESKSFKNKFYVSRITDTDKINNNAQSIVFHLIEDIAYISNLQIVNRSYTGKISNILEKISFNFLQDKGVRSTKTDLDSIKVIVPNLDPLQAMLWLTKRAKTPEGFPFYLYSTLTKNELQFHDLGTMLESQVLNPNEPFRSSPAVIQSIDPQIRRKAILTHKFSEVADLFTILLEGLVGSKFEFIDGLLETRHKFHYDIIKDLFGPLIDKNILPVDQKNPPVSPQFKYDETSFNELDCTYTSTIAGNNQYRLTDNDNYMLGYGEEKTLSEYKSRIIGRSMDSIIRKEPLTMVIDGLDFIDGDKHSTIGNQISVEFPSSKPDSITDNVDKRKSGNYLIFAARHM